jgi:two-component system, sensor histidine kinase and response regulator
VSVVPFPEPEASADSLEDRVERAEAMYRSLVQSLSGVTYAEALDDGRMLSVGPQVVDMLGYSEDEWMSDSLLWTKVIHPEDRDWVVESCERANETGEPWQEEYRMIARDGSVVWIRDEATLVLGTNGQPLCWQGIMSDITARKTAEESAAGPVASDS